MSKVVEAEDHSAVHLKALSALNPCDHCADNVNPEPVLLYSTPCWPGYIQELIRCSRKRWVFSCFLKIVRDSAVRIEIGSAFHHWGTNSFSACRVDGGRRSAFLLC
ncbi:hypothetical protein AMELA_G00244470 [Ameiurus melas]|uniref:Uncharacterized protein n=1 Tax=Ameiurus melas TaxID=219545 RepID=A0A7J5ZSW8_AMEME|nr:hypothetical protein AMELA_G00244470 [Ameiurus melas]